LVENPPTDLVTQGIIYEHFSNKNIASKRTFWCEPCHLKQTPSTNAWIRYSPSPLGQGLTKSKFETHCEFLEFKCVAERKRCKNNTTWGQTFAPFKLGIVHGPFFFW
jgi:hypothetical protein